MNTLKKLVFLGVIAVALTAGDAQVAAVCGYCDPTCNPGVDCDECQTEESAYYRCMLFCSEKGGVSTWWTEQQTAVCGDGGVRLYCVCGGS